MKIKDSGERTKYASGAVRDCKKGKGRFDLMPLDVLFDLSGSTMFKFIDDFKQTGKVMYLSNAIYTVSDCGCDDGYATYFDMFLDVAKHFEAGAEKYGENNWQKGIPLHSYIDSACRHYCKFKAGYDDEPHQRACIWNLMCAMWTVDNHPELDDFTDKKKEV